MPAQQVTSNRRKWPLVAIFLIAGLYLSVSWLLGYVWAGAWNFGLLQNAASIFLGLYFASLWLGLLLSERSRVFYLLAVILSCVALAILVWDSADQELLELHVFPMHIAFAVAALGAALLHKRFMR